MQFVRSLLFNVSIYVVMAIYAVIFAIPAIISPKGARAGCHAWCRYVIWAARWMLGLKVEVRGTPPAGEAMVAAKHQSFFDIIVIYHALPYARFIMKRELMYAPIVGQFSLRIGCIPVDRGKRGQAIAKMKADAEKHRDDPGQLVIYPQGTRVGVDDYKAYKVGTGVLYDGLAVPCTPVATNIGHFWPKRGVTRKPGTAVVEFMEPIQPGLTVGDFMKRLEHDVETRSKELLVEARGH